MWWLHVGGAGAAELDLNRANFSRLGRWYDVGACLVVPQ